MTEIFKPIKNYESLYAVSNLGRVKSLYRIINNHIIDEKILSPRKSKDGYLSVILHKDNKPKTFKIHRLVAETFIPNPENKETVNHKDGNKLNNAVINLEWSTRSEQMYHAYQHKLKLSDVGTQNSNSNLSDDDIKYIRKIFVKNSRACGATALGKKFNVSHRTILNIVERKTYKNVK